MKNVRLTPRTGTGLAFLLLAAGFSSSPIRAEEPLGAKAAPDQALSPKEELITKAHAHYLTARSLEEDGKMRSAVDHYIAFLQTGADDPGLVAHIAEMSLNYRGLDPTLALLEQVALANASRPGPSLNFVLFALTHADEKPGLMDRAVAVSAEALKKFPKDAAVYESAVRVHLLKKSHDKAATVLEEATKQDVASPDFWLDIARTALEVWPLASDTEKRGPNLSKINPFYEKALAKAQTAKDDEAQLEIADYYLFSTQIEKAAQVCEALVKQNKNIDAQKRLVRLYEALDRQADSMLALQRLVKDHPTDVENRRLLAAEFIKRQELPQAVEQLEAALKVGGGDLNDYLQISNLLRFTQQPEKLDRFTIRAEKLYPGEPRVAFYRALALVELKKYPEASTVFARTAEQAETMAPELLDDRFYFSWGVAAERGGNFEDAAKHFDKSIQLTPPDDLSRAANTMNYLGYMWLEKGQHLDKAEQLIIKANELERNNPAFIDSLGWLYMKQGKHSEALVELLKAEGLMEKVTKDDAEILDHIAQTYEKLGQADKAKEYWQRTLDLDPDVKGIRERAEKALGKEKPGDPKDSKVEKE